MTSTLKSNWITGRGWIYCTVGSRVERVYCDGILLRDFSRKIHIERLILGIRCGDKNLWWFTQDVWIEWIFHGMKCILFSEISKTGIEICWNMQTWLSKPYHLTRQATVGYFRWQPVLLPPPIQLNWTVLYPLPPLVKVLAFRCTFFKHTLYPLHPFTRTIRECKDFHFRDSKFFKFTPETSLFLFYTYHNYSHSPLLFSIWVCFCSQIIPIFAFAFAFLRTFLFCIRITPLLPLYFTGTFFFYNHTSFSLVYFGTILH